MDLDAFCARFACYITQREDCGAYAVTYHPNEVGFLKLILGGLAVIQHTNPAPTFFEFLLRNDILRPSMEFVPNHC
jgi:hypothetical protein